MLNVDSLVYIALCVHRIHRIQYIQYNLCCSEFRSVTWFYYFMVLWCGYESTLIRWCSSLKSFSSPATKMTTTTTTTMLTITMLQLSQNKTEKGKTEKLMKTKNWKQKKKTNSHPAQFDCELDLLILYINTFEQEHTVIESFVLDVILNTLHLHSIQLFHNYHLGYKYLYMGRLQLLYNTKTKRKTISDYDVFCLSFWCDVFVLGTVWIKVLLYGVQQWDF